MEETNTKTKSASQNPKNQTRSPFSWVMEFASQKKGHYIASVIIAALGAACQVLPFLVMAEVIRKLLEGNTDFAGYAIDCGIMAALWILRVVFHSVSTRLSHAATFAVLGNIRKRALLKLERMPLGDVQNRGSGELKNILVERIDSIETTLAHLLPEMTGNLCVVIATLIYLFVVDYRIALATLITMPVGLVCFMCMRIGYEKSYKRTVDATKNLNDTAVEYIGGIEVIKVFGKAKSSYQKFVAAAKEGAASYVDWMRRSNIYFTFGMNIMPATLLSVLPIGGWLVRSGSLPVEDFILTTIMAMGLVAPLINFLSYNDDIAKMGTIIGEVTSILTAEEMNRPETSEEQPKDRTITLDNVHFGYGETEVLHGISATFKAGSFNALVGPSGGGKSTIAKLIASFWDVDSGCVRLGGVDIRHLPMNEYMSQIAYVAQDNFLFDDTVRENIRMGRPGASDQEVEDAARNCGCYDFIMGLEKGFDTVVGGDGSHLSGGEKQRICIARAMLKNAPIVILDEATAYTDPENEALIQASVAKLVQGKTLIVIAHRLSTIVDADQIIVIKDGQIDATGTHPALLENSPLYRRMWEAHISSKDEAANGGEQHV